jgi:ATP-dependent Clp protease ATP-binding subunit ClpX
VSKKHKGQRVTCCSFCRKSYREVGPLVEGPGDVYICGECVELCQAIIQQERRRRGHSAGGGASVPSRETIRARLDPFVTDQREAKDALVQAAVEHYNRARWGHPSALLLIGPTRSSKVFLARALAHALEVPFADGDRTSLVNPCPGSEAVEPLLYKLLRASDFDVEAAQRGIVYVDGVDQRGTQEALLRLWAKVPSDAVDHRLQIDVARLLQIDVARLLFICGAEFAGLDAIITGMGRHPEQPVTRDVLLTFGVVPDLVRRFQDIVRVAPLDEETLARIVPWVDLDRMESGGA